jgi:tetratricopeptide (TPR) repeat protein
MAPSVMRTELDTCPPLESIAAYLDQRLPERERAEMAKHLAECENCYFVFTEAAQMRTTETKVQIADDRTMKPAPHALWTAPKLLWSSAAGLAVAASLVLAVATGMLTGNGDSSSMRALVAAVGTARPFEARLSGGFAYGPVRGPVRGAGNTGSSPDVRIAVATIEKEAARDETAKNLHELGIAYLITDDIPNAVVTLERAVARESSARALSDLSAAYLVRGIRENRPEDLLHALALATQTLQRDGSMREALFNRALALDRLSMVDDARQAWQEYLKVDGESGWGAEARLHLRRDGEPKQ